MSARIAIRILGVLLAAVAFALVVSSSDAQTKINLATQVRGVLPAANGGGGSVNGALKGNGAGVISQAACADLSNGAASCSTDTTNAANITSGTLPNARLVSVPNSALANSSVTVGSTSVALGATAATVAGLTLTNPAITVQALTDAATIAWNMNSGNLATVTVATAGRTLGNPTNVPAGGSAVLLITYSGSGTVTSFSSNFKWPGGTAPTMTNAAGKIDMLSCNAFSGSTLYCLVALDVR